MSLKNSCQHVKQLQSIDEVNVQGHTLYHYTLSDGRISDAETVG